MSEKIKVKVIKSKKHYWYSDEVGNVFDVYKEKAADNYVYTHEFDGMTYWIGCEDCEVVVQEEEFDFHKNPWFISIPDPETCKLVQEWLFSKGLYWCGNHGESGNEVKNLNAKEIGNYDTDGFTYVSTIGYYKDQYAAKEIKIKFKKEVSVDSVTYPEYEPEKTEAQKQIEVIEAQIAELNKQVNILKESL